MTTTPNASQSPVSPATSSPPLVIEGSTEALDLTQPDGGLPPVLGAQSFCVFRATRDAADLADNYGWTYHHHVDMACWHGRLYVGWNSCQKDEDLWPSRELYSTSEDGVTWSPPAELFPQGISTCLRMYFYLGSTGRMLAIAGLRLNTRETREEDKGGLVVREIYANHTLGPVFTLEPPPGRSAPGEPFIRCRDRIFVDACRELLADRVFLEQQDLGRLLGDRRMKWHDPANWPGGKVPGDDEKWVSGKAFSFFRRPDQQWIGISKMGFTTLSPDGIDWTQPVVPPTLITGKAKVWAQQTRDGRFALVYNPSTKARYPLVVVTGNDGIHFRDMRVIHGELPLQRYQGRFRSIGPQYVRGISTWADDNSRNEQLLWLVYSMSKEDIWVTRIPLPIEPAESQNVTDDPARWNTYCPKWASITFSAQTLRLENRDPYDYARADRLFPSATRALISFDVMVPADHTGKNDLDIELLSGTNAARAVRVSISCDYVIIPQGHETTALSHIPGTWISLVIDADVRAGTFDMRLNNEPVLQAAKLTQTVGPLDRITFRTGRFRGVAGSHPVPPGSDVPSPPSVFLVRNLSVKASA